MESKVEPAPVRIAADVGHPSGRNRRRRSAAYKKLLHQRTFRQCGVTSERILTKAFVYDSEVIRGLGDHMPLVADIDL